MNANSPAQVTSSTSANPEVNDKRIDTLFSRLGAIYGHIWWSIYQNEKVLAFAKKEWSESLQRFDNATVRDALLALREQNGYPPTLPQFIECCKSIARRKDFCTAVPKTTQTTNVEIAKKHIQTMLKLLKR